MNIVDEIFNDCVLRIGDMDGLYSLYIFDLKNKDIRYKLFEDTHNREKVLKVLKKIIPLYREEEFDMLLIDLDERMIFHRLSDDMLLMLSSSRDIPLGRLLALIKNVVK